MREIQLVFLKYVTHTNRMGPSAVVGAPSSMIRHFRAKHEDAGSSDAGSSLRVNATFSLIQFFLLKGARS